MTKFQGPVVQRIVSLTSSLSEVLYNFITKYTCTAKASHILSKKNIGIFQILTFEIFNETLANDDVSFEQPGRGLKSQRECCRFLYQ